MTDVRVIATYDNQAVRAIADQVMTADHVAPLEHYPHRIAHVLRQIADQIDPPHHNLCRHR